MPTQDPTEPLPSSPADAHPPQRGLRALLRTVARLPRAVKLLPVMLALVAGAVTGCQSFDAQQRKWIFQPTKETWWAGSVEGIDNVWIDFQSKDAAMPVRLNGLWLANERKDAPLMLYLHGARWDVTGSVSRIRRMRELGFSVLAIDYRGFGRSTDVLPSEDYSYEDAHAAWRWLGEHYPGRARYVFGHSLGSTIAVELASTEPNVAGLIVEGGFPSVADVFSTFKWGWLPISALITQRFDAGSRIAQVKAPVLVVHGSADRLIPSKLGRELFEKAPEPKRFVLVEGGSHHNTNSVGEEQYREALHDLFKLPNGSS